MEVVVSFIQSVDAKGKRVMKALANPMTGAQKEGSFDMAGSPAFREFSITYSTRHLLDNFSYGLF